VWICGALAAILLLGVAALPAHAGASAAVQTAAVETEGGASAEAGVAERLDATDAYRLALLNMKGHLSVARALVQLRAPGADYHLRQSMQDIFRPIEAELERRSAPFTADVLVQLENAVTGTPAMTLATIESAVFAIDGSFAQTGAMDAHSVLALSESLLREAVEMYAEAVFDNEVVDLRTYQSGRGFATIAEALVRHSSRLKGRPGHEDLLKAVVLIRQAWPAVIPPAIVLDPPSVAEWLDRVAQNSTRTSSRGAKPRRARHRRLITYTLMGFSAISSGAVCPCVHVSSGEEKMN
jgi:hypothetical protein